MGIVVKNGVRILEKDLDRPEIAAAVHTKVPVQDTDAWAQAQAEEARKALQADLDQQRAEAETALEAELGKRRQEFDNELVEARKAFDADLEKVRAEAETKPAEPAKKVAEPTVTKDRQPSTTKSRPGGEE